MKIINASYEILTDISPYGTIELEQIERAARTCYKSEDKITDQGESAKRLIGKLIENGHEAMLEHSMLSVKFICDRGISHELVRHRLASFAQESTRYCNYSDDKFGNELTFIRPCFFEGVEHPCKDEAEVGKVIAELMLYPELPCYFRTLTPIQQAYFTWHVNCILIEDMYLYLIEKCKLSPQEARCVLSNSLKTEVVMTANYREWRHFFDLRCNGAAHPQMRELTIPLLKEVHERIPVIFDDLYEKYIVPTINEKSEKQPINYIPSQFCGA